MLSHVTGGGGKPSLAEDVFEHTRVSPARCYQCGKCSAGCPLGVEMDFPPSVIMRMLQSGYAGMEEELLGSLTIWLCLSCETCATRCPMEVDIPRVMDYLRVESMRRGMVNRRAKDILSFHQSFLDSIGATGRLYEIGLIAGYKARTFHLFQDILVAPVLFGKGKLKPFPHLIKGRSSIAAIIEKTRQTRESEP